MKRAARNDAIIEPSSDYKTNGYGSRDYRGYEHLPLYPIGFNHKKTEGNKIGKYYDLRKVDIDKFFEKE